MVFELSNAHFHAEVATHGGELVRLTDRSGTEYIWSGAAPFWHGRNPVLFPIVGRLKDGTVCFDGKPFEMAQHGFARNHEFSVLEQTADSITFELREDAETLARYPYPFSLQVRHQLTDEGFVTAFRVENTGSAPMPFCIGAHTAFRCPLHEGEHFEDYEIVFDKAESAETILLTAENLVSHTQREPWLANADRFALDYAAFARLDTLMFDALRSTGVGLLHKKTGRGVHMAFAGFPMIAFWTQGALEAPFLCIEPWHGCAAVDDEGGEFTDKRHCITAQPGEVKVLSYTVTLR